MHQVDEGGRKRDFASAWQLDAANPAGDIPANVEWAIGPFGKSVLIFGIEHAVGRRDGSVTNLLPFGEKCPTRIPMIGRIAFHCFAECGEFCARFVQPLPAASRSFLSLYGNRNATLSPCRSREALDRLASRTCGERSVTSPTLRADQIAPVASLKMLAVLSSTRGTWLPKHRMLFDPQILQAYGKEAPDQRWRSQSGQLLHRFEAGILPAIPAPNTRFSRLPMSSVLRRSRYARLRRSLRDLPPPRRHAFGSTCSRVLHRDGRRARPQFPRPPVRT